MIPLLIVAVVACAAFRAAFSEPGSFHYWAAQRLARLAANIMAMAQWQSAMSQARHHAGRECRALRREYIAAALKDIA
jgi:hypothetical protein